MIVQIDELVLEFPTSINCACGGDGMCSEPDDPCVFCMEDAEADGTLKISRADGKEMR